MKLADKFKNVFLYNNKYRTNSEAVIIACYFNPQKNPYRLSAFRTWYESIKHLNHRIVECTIGDSLPELTNEVIPANLKTVQTENLLWHKETLLNGLVAELPKQFKYVFWLDTDVIFTNHNWLVEAVEVLKTKNLVQPFEYCVHLDQDDTTPSFDITHEYEFASNPEHRHPKLWKSFGSNIDTGVSSDQSYDKHGHVGFAWGARREILDAVPLYDKALVGGADHIIAHAGAGHIPHTCIVKSFTEDLDAVNRWSRKFFAVVRGEIGYVEGDLYHIWHGEIEKRQYLKRIQEHTPEIKNITDKDKNGLYVTKDDSYVKKYFDHREVKTTEKIVPKPAVRQSSNKVVKSPKNSSVTMSQYDYDRRYNAYQNQYPDRDNSFIDSLIWGYVTDSSLMGGAMGGNFIGGMIGAELRDDMNQPVQDNQMPDVDNHYSNSSDTTSVNNVPNDNFS